jgi:hypothetical protein
MKSEIGGNNTHVGVVNSVFFVVSGVLENLLEFVQADITFRVWSHSVRLFWYQDFSGAVDKFRFE